MLVRPLLTALALFSLHVAPVAAQDDVDAERAFLRKALYALQQQDAVTDDLRAAYEQLRQRAWAVGDDETSHTALDWMVADIEATATGEPRVVRLNVLGRRASADGDMQGMRTALERAVVHAEADLEPDHPVAAAAYHNLAVAQYRTGDIGGAESNWKRALEIREAAVFPDGPLIAQTLRNLGTLKRHKQRELAEARVFIERALGLDEMALGPDDPVVAEDLVELGWLEQQLGDFERSREVLERALRITEEAFGPDHVEVGDVLYALGETLRRQGDDAAAIAVTERALAIQESALGPDHPRVADTLNNLGASYAQSGQTAAARPFLERAVAITEELRPPPAVLGEALNNLGVATLEEGDPAAARSYLERALAIRQVTLPPEDPNVASTLHNLAVVMRALGEEQEAWSLLRRSAASRRADLEARLAVLTEAEGFVYMAQVERFFDIQVGFAASLDDPAVTAEAYQDVLAWKGQVGRVLSRRRQQLDRELTAGQRALYEELAAAQAALAGLALTEDVADPEGHDRRLADLRATRDRLERRLRGEAHRGPSGVVTPEDVRAALPERSAVVDLVVGKEILFRGVGDYGSRPDVTAWILRPDGERVVRIPLGPLAVIEEAIAAFLEDLAASRGASLARREARPDVETPLRELLWDRLVPHLEGIDTIFLAPEGGLGTLPFEVLRSADGRYLVEDYAFVYTGDVASLAAASEPPEGDFGDLLAVGGVDFGRRADAVPTGTSGPGTSQTRGDLESYWGRLPATGYESQVVTDMHVDALGEEGRRLLLQGDTATEERLKSELPRHRVAHLATHGFFQPEGTASMWEQARDEASGQERPRMRPEAERLIARHPGLLSGLVCAGANAPTPEGRDDGYLTASEVAWLDLSDTELVVLSACETGLGRPQAGEGLLGLRRAFHLAGADTVISSLWSVKDESTSELMQAFYRNLFFEGLGRHEALRAAQLEMLQRNRREHGTGLPSTWGAFVLSGEWR